jgi:uncharacterized protein
MNPYAPRPIPSPCIKVCEMKPDTKQCTGCYRTIEEIAYWATMGPTARETIMRELAVRRRAAENK